MAQPHTLAAKLVAPEVVVAYPVRVGPQEVAGQAHRVKVLLAGQALLTTAQAVVAVQAVVAATEV
jgi:hypothetical protein